MSTRSLIVITGNASIHGTNQATVRLYKHSDGYPTGNLPIIAEALKTTQAMIAKEKECDPKDKDVVSRCIEPLIGHLIGAATSIYGMGARIDTDAKEKQAYFNGTFNAKHLGNQWDVEWIYIVDLVNKDVSVYQGDFKAGPVAGYNNGPVDPLSYVESLIEECKEDERKAIQKSMGEINRLGFSVNKQNAKVKRAYNKTGAKGKLTKADKIKLAVAQNNQSVA